MRHPPNTVERAFELASDVEKQLQVADSFKLDFPTYPSRELNKMSAEETSGDEQEINEISRNKIWVSNSSSYSQKHQNFNNNRNSNYRHQQQRPQEGETPLNKNQRDLLRELFKDLEVAHEHTARACSVLARLSLSLTAPQLMATLKVVTCPLIQVNALEGLMDKVKILRKAELPDDVEARVQLTMTPKPAVETLTERKGQEPNPVVGSHTGIQNTMQIWKWNNTTRNAG